MTPQPPHTLGAVGAHAEMPTPSRLLVTVATVALLVPTAACDPSTGGNTRPGTADVTGAQETLSFTVGPSGKVAAPVSMDVHEGTDVKFMLDNRSGQSFRLRVVGPDGNDEAVVVAPPKHPGQINVVLARPGRHTVVVSHGAATPAGRYLVQVSR